MRYIGSKVSALPHLRRLIGERAPEASSICDPFAGTCTVAGHFKQLGFQVITGDLLHFSLALQTASVELNSLPRFSLLKRSGRIPRLTSGDSAYHVISHLNNLPGIHGFITEGYSEAGYHRRKFFTIRNAMKIDAIRTTVAHWRKAKLISLKEELFLLAALIEATDRVANTAGTYYAFLKRLTRKARQDLAIQVPRIVDNKKNNCSLRADAREVAKVAEVDVLYLDPPYNARDYNGYYHLPETLSLGDSPKITGLAGIPSTPRRTRSDFCSPTRATEALWQLVQTARSKHILLHYTTKGLIEHKDIVALLREKGRTNHRDISVRGYSARPNDSPRVTHRLYWCHCRT